MAGLARAEARAPHPRVEGLQARGALRSRPQSDKLVDIYIALSEEHYLGWIEVTSNAVGAQVFIDRKDIGAIGRTPFTGHLKPGKHTIYVEKQGFVALEKTIDVKPGTATQYNWPPMKQQHGLDQRRGPARRRARACSSTASSPASRPAAPRSPPAGARSVVEKEGMEDYEAELEVGPHDRDDARPPVLAAPAQDARDLDGRHGARRPRRGRLRRPPLEAQQGRPQRRHQAGLLVDNTDPRFLRGKLEAIGADVLYGFGAIVSASRVAARARPRQHGRRRQQALGLAPPGGRRRPRRLREVLMRARRRPRLCSAGLGLAAAGCDWRDFDDMQSHAPVVTVGGPSHFPTTNDFGRFPLAAVGAALRLLDGGQLRRVGGASTAATRARQRRRQGTTATEQTVIAPVFRRERGVVSGAADDGDGRGAGHSAPRCSARRRSSSLLTVDLASQTLSPFIPSSPLTQTDALLGVGVAAGNLTGAAAPDLVVASSALVHVFVDGSTADVAPGAADLAACPITLSTSLPNNDRRTAGAGGR